MKAEKITIEPQCKRQKQIRQNTYNDKNELKTGDLQERNKGKKRLSLEENVKIYLQ